MCMCACVCMCVYVCLCVCDCGCVYLIVCVRMCVEFAYVRGLQCACVQLCVSVCVRDVSVSECVCVCMCVCVHVYLGASALYDTQSCSRSVVRPNAHAYYSNRAYYRHYRHNTVHVLWSPRLSKMRSQAQRTASSTMFTPFYHNSNTVLPSL
jgi:hypothetical protein